MNRMARGLRLIVLLASFAALAVACGTATTRVTPNPTLSAASSATPAAVASPTPTPTAGATPTGEPTSASGATTTSGPAGATITLGNFGQADGPGWSVKHAIAKAGVEPL